MNGGMESEVKLMSATRFTSNATNPHESINNNAFYPRALIATSSFIGAGLESSSVHSVIRIGCPTSVLDLIQEMGRCGRNRVNDGTNPTDNFYLFLSLRDFTCLNERLHNSNNDESRNDNSRVIEFEEQRQLQRNNLLEVTNIICLNNTCWHQLLENESGSPLQPPSSMTNSCKVACPFCLGIMKDHVMPVNRIGLSKFLAHTFITACAPDLSPLNLVKLSHDFPDVGQITCVRPRANTPPENNYLQSTALQLIASGMIELKTLDDKPNAICSLSMKEVDSSPTCLDSSYWTDFLLV